jgi:hypothetical protein
MLQRKVRGEDEQEKLLLNHQRFRLFCQVCFEEGESRKILGRVPSDAAMITTAAIMDRTEATSKAAG